MESNPCLKLFGCTIFPINEGKEKPLIKLFGFPIVPEKDRPPKMQQEKMPRNEPDLPPSFRGDLGASPDDEVTLIFSKRLFDSDVSCGLTRLSMPRSQIKNRFLTDDEERFLQQKDEKGKPLKYTVEVIDPSLKVRELTLVRWNYNNSGPKSEESSRKRKRRTRSDPSWSYLLSGKWRELVDSNGLKAGNRIQVWAFRRADNNVLRFAIVNLEKESAQARGLDWGKRRKRGSRRSAAAYFRSDRNRT